MAFLDKKQKPAPTKASQVALEERVARLEEHLGLLTPEQEQAETKTKEEQGAT